MKQNEQESIRLVITHCEMLLYNLNGSYSPTLVALGVQSMIPVLLNQFTFMHLVTTMFLVDGAKYPIGGACYQLLEPLGLSHLLEPIVHALDEPVGSITLGDYLRINRNKLAVHGDLTRRSLPDHVADVTHDEDALDQFYEGVTSFEEEVRTLRAKLEELLLAGNARKETD